MHKLIRSKKLTAFFILSILFVTGGTVWAFISLRNSAVPLILHFNDISGISQIGNLNNLLGIGAVGAIMVIVNFTISLEAYPRSKTISWLIAGSTLFFSILLFIGFAAIISVN